MNLKLESQRMGEKSDEVVLVESREWYMASYSPDGVPTSDHLKLRTVKISLSGDSFPDGHVAVEPLYFSIDPYTRSKMKGHVDGLYSDQYKLNEVITAFGIAKVVRSKDINFKEGDVVLHPFLPIAEYCVVNSHVLRKMDASSGISFPDFLTCFGVPGFAAWVSIEVLGEPKEGSNVFISAASCGVGMIAGQLAKLRGCRVIGSTGSGDKVKLIKEEFGYDDGFNYHEETDYDAALSKYFPNGIDVYVDNVGGRMLEAVLNHVNMYARIPLCGMISEYNKVWTEREGVRNLLNMVGKEVRMEGFMIGSYLHRFGEFTEAMEKHVKEGKVKSKTKINLGIESFLDSITSLFSSSNHGKVILQVKA